MANILLSADLRTPACLPSVPKLHEIPQDILDLIWIRLEPSDLARCCMTSRALRSAVLNSPVLWQARFWLDFGLIMPSDCPLERSDWPKAHRDLIYARYLFVERVKWVQHYLHKQDVAHPASNWVKVPSDPLKEALACCTPQPGSLWASSSRWILDSRLGFRYNGNANDPSEQKQLSCFARSIQLLTMDDPLLFCVTTPKLRPRLDRSQLSSFEAACIIVLHEVRSFLCNQIGETEMGEMPERVLYEHICTPRYR